MYIVYKDVNDDVECESKLHVYVHTHAYYSMVTVILWFNATGHSIGPSVVGFTCVVASVRTRILLCM